MADLKISALTAATTPLAGTEVLPLVQSGTTKKVSVDNLTAGKTVPANAVIVGPGSLSAWGSSNSPVEVGLYGSALAEQASGSGLLAWNIYQNSGGSFIYKTTNPGLLHQLGNDGVYRWYSAPSGSAGGSVSLTLRQSIDGTSGDVTVSTGNLVIGTSGKGIDFSATPGTGTSELLADYEEGTWTPVIEGSTSAGTASYSLQNGRYTKVGRQVYVEVAISWSGGTGTGNLTITGLPFTSANGGTVSAMSIALADFVALTAANVMTAFVPSNTTRIEAWQYPTGGGAANNVAYDAGGALYLSGSYTV